MTAAIVQQLSEGPQRSIAVIGAGMAGLSCAGALKAAGHDLTVFETAGRSGGRMSSQWVRTPCGDALLDDGAQFFTVRDPAFIRQVETWERQGTVARWSLLGEDAYVGVPAMDCVTEAMAATLHVELETRIQRLDFCGDRWTLYSASGEFRDFHAVVIAIPPEQAAPLLADYDQAMAATAANARSQPCWTSLFVFPTPLVTERGVVRDEGILGWAGRACSKPGREGPEGWTVHASGAWSSQHLNEAPDRVAFHLLNELSERLGTTLPSPAGIRTRLWQSATSTALGLSALWNPDIRLGACGDWLLAPRVECAWLSGQRLARWMLTGNDFV